MAELESSLGSGEYADWIAYWDVEPWGALRDNMHTGILASILHASAARGKGKKLTVQDFMLKSREEDREQKTGKSLGWLRAIGKRKNGR